MTPMQETHKNLIRWLSPTIEELERKAVKAYRHKQKIWTQEDEDYALAIGMFSDIELDEVFF